MMLLFASHISLHILSNPPEPVHVIQEYFHFKEPTKISNNDYFLIRIFSDVIFFWGGEQKKNGSTYRLLLCTN